MVAMPSLTNDTPATGEQNKATARDRFANKRCWESAKDARAQEDVLSETLSLR